MNVKRSRYIRKLQRTLLAYVYTHQKKTLTRKMEIYAIRNQNLLQANSNTFIFDGVWYSAGDATQIQGNYKPNRELHPDLKEKIINLFQKSFELISQEAVLLTYFGETLLIANKLEDLLELLPYPLHDCIDMVDTEIFDSGHPLTPQEINQFKQDHHEGISILNSMLLLELLMSK